MNEYVFYLELNDGAAVEYTTYAACIVAAYDDLNNYLAECGISGEIGIEVTVNSDWGNEDNE